MRCIYCLEDSSKSKSVPHVLPEAMAQNSLVLPVGVVCDACNHYLGHELDNTLVSHPIASLLIQFLRLPGKRGKVRRRIGNVSSDIHPNAITIPCAEPVFTVAPDGSSEAKFAPLLEPTFSLPRFRRALHHVGLNALAFRDGFERALESAYDEVRRYVKRPHKGENWPYIQSVDLSRGIARDFTVVLLRSEHTECAALVLGKSAAFGVDLRNSGTLAEIAAKEFPSHADLIPADYRPPTIPRKKGAKQYRLTIELD